MKRLLLLFLLFVFHINGGAQQMIARQIPFFYQLSSNEIWDFYQDREGYLWVGTMNGLARYDGYRLQSFRSDYKSVDLLTNNSVVCMSDNDLYVWIGTRKGVSLFEKETCRIIPVPGEGLKDKSIDGILTDKNAFSWVAAEGKVYKCSRDASILKEYTLAASGINSIYEDHDGNIWVLIWGGGVFKYEPATDTFINYPRIGEHNAPFIMYQDQAGNYWIGTWGEGLWQFFPDQVGLQCYKRHHVINSRSGQSDPIFYSLTQDNTFGYLWALSHNELYALKVTDGGILENVDIHDLLDTHMMYTRIFKDRNGNLWLSSYDMAYTIFFDDSKIINYPMPQIKERLGWDANIVNLCLDNDGFMWVNQDRYGLSLYDMYHDRLSDNHISNYPGTFEARVISRSNLKGGVWIGTGGTPHIIRLMNRNMKMYVEEDIDLRKLIDNPGDIDQLVEDVAGNLWILTSAYLFLKPANQESLILTDRNLPEIAKLTVDSHGKVWAISEDRNIYLLNSSGGNIMCELNSSISILLESEDINHVCIDREDCLWLISSLGRIYRSDRLKQTFTNVSLEKEIEESSVIDMLADNENVWIVTNKKVIQYSIDDELLYNFSTSDGNIFVNVFRNKAVTQDNEGGIYAGGHGGFTSIRPIRQAQPGTEVVHPVVTDVRADNQSVFFSKKNAANTIRKVFLDANDRNIEIYFSTLQYSLNAKERIAYMLEGVDKDWVYLDPDKNVAFYNRLGKGTYQFRLKSASGYGKWSNGEVLLTIEKLPAIYETWYAYLFYILIVGLSAYLVLREYFRRLKARHNIRFREELNRAKLDYFTNVSHEILTPLTIISCTADNMETQGVSFDKQSKILKSNVEKLKRLIQQMLDFRKMDMGKMQLNVTYGDIKGFITVICQTGFQSLARKKNITLSMHFSADELYGYLDFDKLDKVLYNLLSNALKYTPKNKQVRVSAQKIQKERGDFLQLKIEDEGVGISSKETDKIFTRFYNNKESKGVESNGIGLSLTRDLVNLHHGTITVESVPGEGSCFTVELPIGKGFYHMDEPIVEVVDEELPDLATASSVFYEDAGKYSILLVDDNTELLYLLKEMFGKGYQVITATSGKQAWEKLNGNEVDIVISDVMMPDENGWEFCKRIKSDIRFSHIPVIILTAKNGTDDRVSSYEVGADGYVAKPFDLKVLSARVDNLIKSYKMRQEAFRKEQNLSLESLTDQSVDKKFIQSIMDRVMEHIEEPEFDLEKLASEMNMSKSTLYRKIKSITGLTPLDFVRNIKMKQACILLQDKSLTISEIAYSLGFNNPKYFSRCFKEEFGVTPSEYLN